MITYHANGRPHEIHDDSGRIFSRFDDQGNRLEQRPYTEEELAPIRKRDENRQLVRRQLEESVPALLITVDSIEALLSEPRANSMSSEMKQLVRDVLMLSRSMVRASRLLTEALDSPETN